jgi:ribosomal protein S18 acetylase RimI-like enzyme
MLTTRFATAADAALIADISRQTFYDTFAIHNTAENMDKFMEQQFSHAALIKEVMQAENIFLLAFSEDKPAGYAFLREKNLPAGLAGEAVIEIARIYAMKEFIGKGVGKKLMEECIIVAKQKQKNVVWLGVWEHNRTAIDFYRKWGFEKFSSHAFVLGDDVQEDWLMKKDLV